MARNQEQKSGAILFLVGFLLAGCASIKQCAYEGFKRNTWQQPDKVVAALELSLGDHVADLGSGSGYFAFRLAKAVGPSGKVYAVDVDPAMNDLVAQRAMAEAVKNLEVILAKPDDPLLPASGVDLIFTVNTYHLISHRVNYFANLQSYLRPGGRVAVIDFDRRSWLAVLVRHYTPAEIIRREMEQAGFALQREFAFLDRQSFLIFAPHNPPPTTGQRPSAGAVPQTGLVVK